MRVSIVSVGTIHIGSGLKMKNVYHAQLKRNKFWTCVFWVLVFAIVFATVHYGF